MNTVRIFTPLGRPHRDAAPDWHRNALGADLRSGVIGVVDNAKPNARALMSAIGERLTAASFASKVSIKRKASPSHGVSDAAFGELEYEASLVLLGSAD